MKYKKINFINKLKIVNKINLIILFTIFLQSCTDGPSDYIKFKNENKTEINFKTENDLKIEKEKLIYLKNKNIKNKNNSLNINEKELIDIRNDIIKKTKEIN